MLSRVSTCVCLIGGLISLSACETIFLDGAPAEKSDEVAFREISDLIGVWDVALYYDPSQPPSSTVMEINDIADGALTGTFYGSDFEIAQAVIRDGEVIFSAVTSDGTGPYAHAGRFSGDVIIGQTLSTGRNFVMPWEATRRTDDEN